MSDQSIPDQESVEVTYSFGQRLSSARRALNLTQEQVATELRLKEGLINALEEEDYDALPAHIYTAGYLRNYARLLNIPAEPLIEALNNAQLETPPLISKASQPRKTPYNKLLVKLFSLLVIIVVIAGIVSWVKSQDFSWFAEKQDDAKPAGQQGLTALPELLPEAEGTIIEPAATEAEVVVKKVTPEPVVAPVPADTTTSNNEELVTEKVPVPEVVKETTNLQPAKEGVELVLNFSKDCWAEVTDSTGKRLAFDLYRAGSSKQVNGAPPFDIFLGNAVAVSIEYNGQAYDFSEHVNRNLARFSLGQAEDDKSNAE